MPTCASCGYEAEAAFKFCPECGAPAAAAAPAREQRKVVTVLFCDVTGSTALGERLDPEPLRALLARYFARMKAIVEAHGGTVEKFIGDAVMAVFGVPVLHEDDALRACRAAVEMRDALPELGVQGRLGVTTGEVVTGTEERLATGDPVNVAARLEQAAAPGEVLIGAETLQLVREAVEVEPVEPLALKGKSEPVPAYRLLSAAGEARRAHAAPMVGRGRQRRLLAEAFAAVVADRACHLFTVLGAAGVGKSRLVAEFLADLDAAVVVGRCRSYGAGVAYTPVVEVLRQIPARPDDETAAAAVAALLGESEQATSPDELAWAVRKTLEAAAAERPLVCVLDDLHWGEPGLLDLVEHVADWSRDAPILLLCMARPELHDRRPGWAGGKLNATTVLLEPLTGEETDELIEALLGEAPIAADLRRRIADAAEGNPLFVEEMLALVRESGDGEVTVPPSIHALLAARLDQLDPADRAVLERGAVEGKVFHRLAVEALHPEEPQVPARLMALVRKELVRPDRARHAGDDAFRFRHLLIRDAAYDALPKAVRAELHERFAGWLAERADLVELDEVVGHHLEQACRYRAELGEPVDPAVAREASGRLAESARQLLRLGSYVPAAGLLERAAALAPEPAAGLDIDLVRSLLLAGRPEDAYRWADGAAAAAEPRRELHLRLLQAAVLIQLEPEGAAERLESLANAALPELEADGDDVGLHLAHQALAAAALMHARFDESAEAQLRSLEHARRAGLGHLETWIVPQIDACYFFGSTPVADVLAWIDELEAAGDRHPAHRTHRAGLLAMQGRFDESRRAFAELLREQQEQAVGLPYAFTLGFASEADLLAGDAAAAVEHGEESVRRLEQSGDRGWTSTNVGRLAQAYYALDRLDEAEQRARRADELGAADDAMTQMTWRQALAKVLARRGDHDEARRLAREAVAIGEQTQMLDTQAEAHRDLGEVLALGGLPEEAAAALEEALRRHERKGNVVGAARARSLLEALPTRL